jgi:small subunit ribosomal protein S16
MVRIRLRRMGKKKQPSYRVVVADIEAPRDGRFIENIGFYNPRTDPPTIEIDEERALYWLSQGAQPSDSVAHMLRKLGVMAKHEASKHSDVEAPEPAVELNGETDA